MAWLGVGLLCLAQGARAQSSPKCGGVQQDDEVERMPAVGAREVRLDAPVLLRYRDPVALEELQDPIELFRMTDEGLLIPVAGTVQQIDEHTLHFRPLGELEPDARYTGDVALPGVRLGGNAPRPDVRFHTGDAVDEEAPTLDFPQDDLDLASGPVSPQCDAEEGSYLVSLSFDRAQDDGSPGSIEYFLYLTRAEGIDQPVLKQRVRNFSDRVTMSFVLAPDEVETPVCISVVAVDGVGKATEAREHCFDPIREGFFASCAVSPPRFSAGTTWVWLALAGIWLRRRRFCSRHTAPFRGRPSSRGGHKTGRMAETAYNRR